MSRVVGAVARRSERVHLRLTPGEVAALEAVRGVHPGFSQADALAWLCRLECGRYALDPACAEALRLLEVEGREAGSKAGRPATAPRAPRPEGPAPERVRVGARFEHRWWTVRGKAGGAPLVCEVVALEGGDVVFRRLRQDGRGAVKETRRHARSDFEAAHVGRWLEGAQASGAT